MDNNKLREVEKATLATFRKHRPSEYFSHLNTEEAFLAHEKKVENLYRFGLMLPPEFFANKRIIDLGSGTGEHTIFLARWGANCTLVELNPEAIEISKKIFNKYTNNPNSHEFINKSLYDIDIQKLKESFDVSHSRGVFMHVADKKRAFDILATLAKPGGYIIYGDRNTYGGIQEMLQRYAIYKLGGTTEEKIIEIAESLFSYDIDRSQKAVPRTREAIIFDRWVIQQQDDPTIEEVLGYFENHGLQYVTSWPRIDFAGRGVSIHTDPKNYASLYRGAMLIQNLWMMLNQGELENILSCEPFRYPDEYYTLFQEFGQTLRNTQINTNIQVETLLDQVSKLLSKTIGKQAYLIERLKIFYSEVETFLKLISNNEDISKIRQTIDKFQILFKGYTGVRHVDYVAYKPK